MATNWARFHKHRRSEVPRIAEAPVSAMSNRSLRKRNRSLDGSQSRFRILKIHRAETAAEIRGLWCETSNMNLEMSESKSSWFAWVISAHFEKVRRFGPFLKRLAVLSECRVMVTAYQRHTRPSPPSACGP